MKIYNKLIKTISLITVVLSINVSAAEMCAIIASKNIKTEKLSKKELSNIFLGKTTILEDGTHVKIAYSTLNDEKVDYFFDEYIGQNQRRFKKYWLKKVFAGYGVAPKIFTSNELAIEYVKEKENTIAFITVDDKNLPKDVRLISVDGSCF